MELISLHIDAFGQYRSRDFSFEKGFTLIYGLNEQGKSTLIQFIRVMLYGIGDNRDTGGQLALRRRYLPFAYEGKIGGSLRFSHEGRRYHLQREFGQAPRYDTLHLSDADTGEEIVLASREEVGEHFLTLDETSFLSTFYIGQMNLSFPDKAADMLSTRLENLTAAGDETQAYAQVDAVLRKKAAALQGERSGSGQIARKTAELEGLKEEYERILRIYEQESLLQKQLSALTAQRASLVEKQARNEYERRSQLFALRKSYEDEYARQKAERDRRIARLTEIDGVLSGDRVVVDDDFMNRVQARRDSYVSAAARLEQLHAQTLEKQAEREKAAQAARSAEPALSEAQFEEARQQVFEAQRRRREAEDALSALREQENELLKKNRSEQELAREKEQLLLRAQMERQNRIALSRERLRAASERIGELEARDAAQRKSAAAAKAVFDQEQANYQDAEARLKNAEEQYAESGKKAEETQKLAQEARTEMDTLHARQRKVLLILGGIALFVLLLAGAAYLFLPRFWIYPLFAFPILLIGLVFLPSAPVVQSTKRRLEETTSENEQAQDLFERSGTQLEQHKAILELNARQRSQAASVFDAENRVLSGIVISLQNAQSSRSQAQKDLDEALASPAVPEIVLEPEDPEEFRKVQSAVREARDEADRCAAAAEEESDALLALLRVNGYLDQDALTEAFAAHREALAQEKHADALARQAALLEEAQRQDLSRTLEAYCAALSLVRPVSGLDEADRLFAGLRHLRQEREVIRSSLQSTSGVLEHLKFESNAFPADDFVPDEIPVYDEKKRRFLEENRETLRTALENINHEVDILTERLRSVGGGNPNPDEITARIRALEEEIGRMKEEHAALQDARQALSRANEEMRRLFAPQLNQRSTVYMQKLTGREDTDLFLKKDFSMTVQDDASMQRHDARYYSGGTMDQFYLSVRLALCDTLGIASPLLLDDSLVQFDDARALRALQCIHELSSERQVLMFTCHSRLLSVVQDLGGTILYLS